MRGSRKKCEKPPFLSFWAKKAHFGQFLAKMAKMVKMIKKALGTFFLTFLSLTNCKVSEKSNERFSRNRVTDVRTYGRTDERTNERTNVIPQVSFRLNAERPKSMINPHFEPFQAKNYIILTIFGQKRPNFSMAKKPQISPSTLLTIFQSK